MPKQGFLGLPFPVFIGILVVFLILLAVGFAIGPLGKSMFGDLGLPSWLIVPQPAPELRAEEVFHLGGFPITNSIIAAWITMIFLTVLSYFVSHPLN